jgi:hypothetical protein
MYELIIPSGIIEPSIRGCEIGQESELITTALFAEAKSYLPIGFPKDSCTKQKIASLLGFSNGICLIRLLLASGNRSRKEDEITFKLYAPKLR